MCRMVALSFRGEASETARGVLKHLVEASRSDPYLREIAGDSRHCHGYGYVAALRRKAALRRIATTRGVMKHANPLLTNPPSA